LTENTRQKTPGKQKSRSGKYRTGNNKKNIRSEKNAKLEISGKMHGWKLRDCK